MSKITLEQLKDKLEGVQSYGHYFACRCVFHDDTRPSLMVYKDGFFRCSACGVSGNFDKLWRKLQGWDISKPVKEATSFHTPLLPTTLPELEVVVGEAHEALMKFDTFQWYLKNRGVEGRIEVCQLGWWNSWVTIPVFDEHHALQGVVLRASSAIQHATGQRFAQPLGQKGMMYVPDWHLFNHGKAVAVVFGMFDALALSDLRLPVCTSTSGKGSFKAEWLDNVRKPIYIIPDLGEEDAAMKLAGQLGWRGNVVRLPYPVDCKDPAGYLETGRRDQLLSLIGGLLC